MLGFLANTPVLEHGGSTRTTSTSFVRECSLRLPDRVGYCHASPTHLSLQCESLFSERSIEQISPVFSMIAAKWLVLFPGADKCRAPQHLALEKPQSL